MKFLRQEQWDKIVSSLTGSGSVAAPRLIALAITEATEGAAGRSSTKPFEEGTYAFKSLRDAESNCKETVDYWKAAFKNFTGLPPPNSKDENPYKSQDNISFVALYKPSSSATADCRVVTCIQTTTSTPVDGVGSTYVGGGTTKNGYALICKTMPAAFGTGSSAPFTQEQWDRIVPSLTGTASIPGPSFVALAIVISGITAFI
ncbi:SAG family member [Eimeria tenella]|uniref:SAG family member n=1 Tax=Eimeria tenella TaxID=5802 RepID=U6KUM0_EIMTE|nr:SAG family member [Eimeria tenella]CDJ40613.1 SAG family member [Eimeria tenella]|eukprot:XP_013231363.1 SAG family member [Eimeria tenella]